MPCNAINAPTQPWQNDDEAKQRPRETWRNGGGRRRKKEERGVHRRCTDESVSLERVLRYGSPVSDALKCESTLKSIVCVDDTGFGKRTTSLSPSSPRLPDLSITEGSRHRLRPGPGSLPRILQ